MYNDVVQTKTHMQLMQRVDDEQLAGSGFVFDWVPEVFIKFCQTHNFKASPYIELPR